MKCPRAAITVTLVIALSSSNSFGYDTLDRDVKLAFLGIGLAAGGLATGVYLAVHHSHTSVSGCVVQSGDMPRVVTGSGKSYELLDAPPELKQDERLSFRGHKTKTASGQAAFRVDHISKDRGPCKKT